MGLKSNEAARGAAKRYKNSLNIGKNQDIIKKRISDSEYNTTLSKQQYLKHVEGTKQYVDYMNTRISKGRTPQSKITLNEEETQNLIDRLQGTGEPKTRKNGDLLNIEYVSNDKVVGKVYKQGEWIETRRAAIHYGKKASHIVPVEEKYG